ncbi:hypothetical protein ElyMa_004990300 [Elysia marginata]|uniref:Uncharacterized protein n=1 Tax=Elysia marginata TaxID=1093978 RepID=A0AAV4J9W1_9GAST|nr:hypothetical protein ElyMa_004990300 [Elysia marginata]
MKRESKQKLARANDQNLMGSRFDATNNPVSGCSIHRAREHYSSCLGFEPRPREVFIRSFVPTQHRFDLALGAMAIFLSMPCAKNTEDLILLLYSQYKTTPFIDPHKGAKKANTAAKLCG